jgi:hypothetical protein
MGISTYISLKKFNFSFSLPLIKKVIKRTILLFLVGLLATVFKNTLELPTVAAIPCIAVTTFVCCYMTTKIISLIPGSKWIIG